MAAKAFCSWNKLPRDISHALTGGPRKSKQNQGVINLELAYIQVEETANAIVYV